MGKIFGILMIVMGVWVGLTVYTEGVDRAFGGLFGRLGLAGPRAESSRAVSAGEGELRSPAKRIGDRVGSSYRFYEDRTQRLSGGE